MSSPSTVIREGLKIRPVTIDDAERVTNLLNLVSQHDRGEDHMALADLLNEWRTPELNFDTDLRVVLNAQDEIIAYGELWDFREPHSRPGYFARIHPEYRGMGLGTELIQWGWTRAQDTLKKAPPEARITLGSGTDSRNADAKQLFENNGFTYSRSFYSMRIELHDALPAPVWPEGITIRTHVPGVDDRPVYEAVEEAFADHWGHTPMSFEHFKQFMLESPDFDASVWFIAMAGNEIAGLSLCFPKPPEDPDLAWLGDLCVRRPWRKAGLGLALLHHTFTEFYRRGKKRVGLGVDSQNLTGALRLYHRAGMHVHDQYDRYEKEIRPGIELSTQNLGE